MLDGLWQRGLAVALSLGPPRTALVEAHAGEGGYLETEAAIRALLGDDGDDVGVLRSPEDDPGRVLVVPDRRPVEGAYNGPLRGGRRLGRVRRRRRRRHQRHDDCS